MEWDICFADGWTKCDQSTDYDSWPTMAHSDHRARNTPPISVNIEQRDMIERFPFIVFPLKNLLMMWRKDDNSKGKPEYKWDLSKHMEFYKFYTHL